MTNKNSTTKLNVWDTYVRKSDGSLMHFDILAPTSINDEHLIHGYGESYLNRKGYKKLKIESDLCRFCHIEEIQPTWESEIEKNGFYILEMEGCD